MYCTPYHTPYNVQRTGKSGHIGFGEDDDDGKDRAGKGGGGRVWEERGKDEVIMKKFGRIDVIILTLFSLSLLVLSVREALALG